MAIDELEQYRVKDTSGDELEQYRVADQPEKPPSYFEAAKTGLKESLYSGLRRFEAPIKATGIPRALEKAGYMAPGLEASEYFKPTEEEARRPFSIPQQVVRGLAGAPATIASYAPYIGALGPVGGFIAPEAAELAGEAVEGKPRPIPEMARRLGESAALGLGFKYLPPGLRYRIPGLAGMFGAQSFIETPGTIAERAKASIAPTIIGGLMGLMPGGREQVKPTEMPLPHDYYANRPYPGGPYLPVPYEGPRPGGLPAPIGKGGPPVDMVYNVRTGRYEPRDMYEAQEPQQLPYGRELPQPGGEHYGPMTTPPPVADWIAAGRDTPFIPHPPVPYEPRIAPFRPPEAAPGPPEPTKAPTPAPTLAKAGKVPEAPLKPLTDQQMGVIRTQAGNVGGVSIDMVKRWTGVGTKRANAALESLVNSGEVIPGEPGDPFPWKFKGAGPRVELDPEISGTIQELQGIIKMGEPGRKMGDPLFPGETISWGTSQAIEAITGYKGASRADTLEAIDKGLRGEEFKTTKKRREAGLKPVQQEIWESLVAQAKGIMEERKAQDETDRVRSEIAGKEPELPIQDLTKHIDDEIMGLKEELREEHSEAEIDRAIQEATKNLPTEGAPPDLAAIETEVRSLLIPKVEPADRLYAEITTAAQKITRPGETLDENIARTKDWISSVLTNDEVSTNPEMVDYFQKEGGFSKEVAEYIVSKRNQIRELPLGVKKEMKAPVEAEFIETARRPGLSEGSAEGTPGIEPVISPTDLNYDLAERAHSGTSWTPETRAKGEQTEYVREMTAIWDGLKKLAKTPEDMELAKSEFERYKQEWLRRYSEVLRSRSGLVSTMIAGPSKFPTQRMNKKNEVHSRKVDEFLEWDKKAQKAMQNKVSHKPPRAISSDREDAVETLKLKIKKAEEHQEKMKAANAVIRSKKTDAEKVEALNKELGLSEAAGWKLLQPDFMGRKGFPQYETTNNSANIRRMKDRVEELTREKAKPAMSAEFDGGRIEENLDNNRIQIFFDAKPDKAMIEKLKGNGFHWSPREGAWQRLKNANARAAVERLFKEKMKGPKIPEEEKVVEFKPTEYETETREGAPEIDVLKDTEYLNKVREPLPAPSPTRAGEQLLPGMKVGLEMKGAKEGTAELNKAFETKMVTDLENAKAALEYAKVQGNEPAIAEWQAELDKINGQIAHIKALKKEFGGRLEGTPLGEAARKAEIERVQPDLPLEEGPTWDAFLNEKVSKLKSKTLYDLTNSSEGRRRINKWREEFEKSKKKPFEPSPGIILGTVTPEGNIGIGGMGEYKTLEGFGLPEQLAGEKPALIFPDHRFIALDDRVDFNGKRGTVRDINEDKSLMIAHDDGTATIVPIEQINKVNKIETRQVKDTPEGPKIVDESGNKFEIPKPEPEPSASADPLKTYVDGKGIDYDSLTDKQKERWRTQFEKEDKEKSEFRMGETPKEPLSRESVDAFAKERLKILKNAPETEIVDTINDIPERIRAQVDENLAKGIKGVYDPVSKKIFLVREMLGSEEDVLRTIEHEAVGHYGTEAYLGKESEPFFNRVYLKYGRTGLKDIADERGFDLNTREGRLNAAREKIAQLAETNENPGLLKQFYSWIREQLRRVFPDLKLSDVEIQTTIAKARQSIISGEFAAREAKIQALKDQVRRVTGLSLEERFQPAQFSISGKAREVGKAAYEEEIKPTKEGVKKGWERIVNLISPTTGVLPKNLDLMFKFLGERELARNDVELKTEAGFNYLNKLSEAERIDLIDKIQTGYTFDELPANLREIARDHRAIEDSLFIKANAVFAKMDRPSLIAYLENHVRNFWKVVPRGLMDEIQRKGFEGLSRKPIEGTRAPLHHQYWTLKEGMANGGVPFTTNLMEITRLNHADTTKLLTAHDMWNAFGETGLRKFVKFGEAKPEGLKFLDDRIANQYFPPKEAGRWAVEENVGRLLENYLSRDLVRENPITKGIMAIKNVTTALELGFSAFHASFETFEAAASQMGLGMQKIWNQGMIKEGLKDILTAPKAGYDLFKIGKDWYRLMRNPDEFIKTTAGQKFIKMFPEAQEDIGWLFYGGGSMRMNESYRINSLNAFRENINSKNYIGAALRSIPALSQVMMRPLFETYIPALKRAQFLRQFNYRKIDQAADLLSGKTTKAEMARDVWRSVENRFGEMNFDNLWWNRTFKSGLQMMVRSVTWKLGNIREYGKGVTGQSAELLSALKEGRMPKLTQEMAWMWGVASLTAAMAGIVQYVSTGKSPENWKDLVYPQIDNQGGRLSLPTYARDFFSVLHSPLKYVGASMAGWFGRFSDIVNNKDFYGVQVHDPSENVLMKRIDDLIHLAPLPFSIQSMKRFREEGQPVSRQVAGFLGATKAPYWIERTDAEQKASDLKAAHLPIGGRTAADFERGNLLKNYAKRYQQATLNGEPTDEIVGNIHKDIREGKLHMEDLLRFRQRIQKEPLVQSVMNLPFRDILQVWGVASTEERKKLAPILMRKYAGLRSPEDRVLYLPKIKQIREEMTQ